MAKKKTSKKKTSKKKTAKKAAKKKTSKKKTAKKAAKKKPVKKTAKKKTAKKKPVKKTAKKKAARKTTAKKTAAKTKTSKTAKKKKGSKRVKRDPNVVPWAQRYKQDSAGPWTCPKCGPLLARANPLYGEDERHHCPNLDCDAVVTLLSKEDLEPTERRGSWPPQRNKNRQKNGAAVPADPKKK